MSAFDRILNNIRKGISGSGALMGDLIDRAGNDGRTALEPGDIAVNDHDGNPLYQVASPIAYDLWYLRHQQNILAMDVPPMDAVPPSYLDGPLDFLDDKLGGMKPLCFIRNLSDLTQDTRITQRVEGVPISAQWLNLREYFIHLMPFEMWAYGLSETVPSAGPGSKYGFKRNEVVGYLAFPVGQLGVMEVISILRQSVIEADDFDLTDDLRPVTDSVSDFFFPPIDANTGKNKCVGDHLIKSGYVAVDDRKRGLEMQASPFPESFYVDAANMPKMWMRYWIHGDETFPIPGEFLGIICKPLALPPHVWWFQETSPLVYAGNWFETSNLTGGVVEEIVLEADREDDGIGNLYTVKVQGRPIKINAIDFLPYEVGDRVGVLKVDTVIETPQTESFRWSYQIRLLESDEEQPFGNDEYVIIPIDFYKET
jgi:hypothetical protein